MKPATYVSILGLATILTAPVSAQQLTRGTWTGTLKLAGGPEIAVELLVRGGGDRQQITMKAVDGPASPVLDLQVTDREIGFLWGNFSCFLVEADGSTYRGVCETPSDPEHFAFSRTYPCPQGLPRTVHGIHEVRGSTPLSSTTPPIPRLAPRAPTPED